ncbi:head-tail joining protein [Desulfatitalea tepidiphila]|uniref:head-tail joining protein n=1 Tax=Desulfatitalea tepidiphila TaxID=1185843 RepID=UPI0006B41FA3|nr:hypothetical protein [Desulfatitalea tepidiphila]
MNLDDAKSAALAVWFDTGIAESITYNGSAIPGHISYSEPGKAAYANHAVLTVRRSDVPAPAYRDTVVIDGATWRVYQDDGQAPICGGDELTWDIPIMRGERRAI